MSQSDSTLLNFETDFPIPLLKFVCRGMNSGRSDQNINPTNQINLDLLKLEDDAEILSSTNKELTKKKSNQLKSVCKDRSIPTTQLEQLQLENSNKLATQVPQIISTPIRISSAPSGTDGGNISSSSKSKLSKPVRRKKRRPPTKLDAKLPLIKSQTELLNLNLPPATISPSHFQIQKCIQISEILPGELYVGSKDNLTDKYSTEAFDKYGITTVISIMSDRDYASFSSDNFILPKSVTHHEKIELLDRGNANIIDHFRNVNELISNSPGATFIHCQKGISRSVTLCIAYLIECKTFEGSFAEPYDYVKEALRRVREKRPIAEPNLGFMGQLSEYAKQTKFIDRRYVSSSKSKFIGDKDEDLMDDD
jgi:predicted protein tyrosine phosphatase